MSRLTNGIHAGGTFSSAILPARGFEPTAFLFDNPGNALTPTKGTCSHVGQDPATSNCDKLYFRDTWASGAFTLALAVWEHTTVDTTPVDTVVAGGFVKDGDPASLARKRDQWRFVRFDHCFRHDA
jgi:hypothetical protein